MVEAIMEERRPKTQEKTKQIARARGPTSDTCSISMTISNQTSRTIMTEREKTYYMYDQIKR